MYYYMSLATYPDKWPETSLLIEKPCPYLVLLLAVVTKLLHVAMSTVRSYRTISPLPNEWRYIFCCPVPRVTSGGCYPLLLFHGARTFLQRMAVILLPPACIINNSTNAYNKIIHDYKNICSENRILIISLQFDTSRRRYCNHSACIYEFQ